MDRVILGDNQFFAVNHLSDERSRQQAIRFKEDQAIIDVLNTAIDCGVKTFMCTTHDRIANICEHIRNHSEQYSDFKIFPCSIINTICNRTAISTILFMNCMKGLRIFLFITLRDVK